MASKGTAVEVKIGVQNAARELVLESPKTPDEITEAVSTALSAKGNGTLVLVDERGRRIVVPVDKLAYIEIGEQAERRVGFGAM
jgi:Protein of unknown function (DUF3107)